MKVEEIIIHCTATQAGCEVTVEDIDRWHRDRGFRCIGYHYVIYLDGSIHPGRSEYDPGAHCLGHNYKSIGVCYVGGLDKHLNPADTRTSAQKQSLHQLISWLLQKYPDATVHGHYEFANKRCPCFDVQAEHFI